MSDTQTTTGGAAATLRAREQRLRELYATSDAWQADRLGEFLAADVAFRFGNAPPARGVAAIQALSGQMRLLLAGIEHDVLRIVHGQGDYATVEVEMRYTRRDGAELNVPSAVVFHFGPDELVDEYRIAIDTGDFFA
jgi:hypothetical protein